MSDGEDIVEQAQAGDRTAMTTLFSEVHPQVVRLARSLCGRSETAERVIDTCFRHALNVLPRWSSGIDPQNWFIHHALLTTRRLCVGRPDANDDLLAAALSPAERTPAYLAMIRAVRRLPPQQAEAFILHHTESLNPRLIGVAMDCSMQAAVTHLSAADNALRQLIGDDFVPLTEKLRRACAALTPPRDDSRKSASAYVATFVRQKRRRQFVRLVAILLLLGVVGAAWYLFRNRIL